jgi:hypothetical protein
MRLASKRYCEIVVRPAQPVAAAFSLGPPCLSDAFATPSLLPPCALVAAHYNISSQFQVNTQKLGE